MLRRIFSSAIILAAVAMAGAGASAQSGEYMAYAPYSIFGIGDLCQQGSAYHRSMAGVGIASRSNRYLNSLNPASLPVRDTLSFMLDFSLINANTLYRQGDMSSARNITNIGSMTLSFPIVKGLAMMAGVSPYSAGGYGYSIKETDPAVLAHTGNITYYDYGQGALYKLYGGLGYSITKSLSVGAEADYIFGNYGKYFTEVFSQTGYNKVQDSYMLRVHSFTGKFGLQYEQKLNTRTKLGFGATYTLGSDLKGTVDYNHQSVGTAETITVASNSDTLGTGGTRVRLASELGFGVILNVDDRLRAEIDYSYADWTGTGMGTAAGFANPDSKTPFAAGVRQSFRAGVEFTPDRYNVRYHWKRYSYRAGAYYTTEYYKVAGNEIGTFGITFGATIPVREAYLHNGISLGVDMGQRGTTGAGLVRERYIRFCVGLNLHDIWFQKRRYE